MQERTIYDSGVIRETLRDLTTADADRVALIIAGRRKAADDGIAEDAKLAYWLAKTNTATSEGFARGLFVNGGAVAGAALALPDTMSPGRAVLLCSESMWDEERTQAELLADARTWAQGRGLQLTQRVVRIEFVPV